MMLFVLKAMLLAASVAASPATGNADTDAGALRDGFLAPLSSDCANNFAELLLLRQELRLTEVVEVGRESLSGLADISGYLREIRDAIAQKNNAEEHTECTGGFRSVGGKCMLLASGERLSWADARLYCQRIGADLASFQEANSFAAILNYVKEINVVSSIGNVWVGGSDTATEDVWLWTTGERMPRGSPFWGSRNNYASEPGGGVSESCSILFASNQYYMHDIACTTAAVPLCMK
ncbi:type-2 ice-structuring protein-like [Penaeus japonicus]|uniref:type-2 ice-structuring protein-like n=1 Tax=Penaeus japonicus TaxID=27405 RepID=UPI001C70D608|nr:type-2 ice-structuring protein-like [Penaeus japonicus]